MTYYSNAFNPVLSWQSAALIRQSAERYLQGPQSAALSRMVDWVPSQQWQLGGDFGLNQGLAPWYRSGLSAGDAWTSLLQRGYFNSALPNVMSSPGVSAMAQLLERYATMRSALSANQASFNSPLSRIATGTDAIPSGSAPPPPADSVGSSDGSMPPSNKVYVFGDRQNGLGISRFFKNAIRKNKVSKKAKTNNSVPTEEEAKMLRELYAKLDPQSKAIVDDWMDHPKKYNGKSLVIGESGDLVGLYDTKEMRKLNNNFQSWKENQFDTFKVAEGQEYDVAYDKFQSPLTFDLDGNGVKTSASKVRFDIDGDGDKDLINDVADGVLVFNGGDHGGEVFGNNTDLDGDGKADGYNNGFEALAALARKEGLIDPAKGDMTLSKADLEQLERDYDLAIKVGYNGEAKSLSSLGISEINLSDSAAFKESFDAWGNKIQHQAGATFVQDGATREYADVWHKTAE